MPCFALLFFQLMAYKLFVEANCLHWGPTGSHREKNGERGRYVQSGQAKQPFSSNGGGVVGRILLDGITQSVSSLAQKQRAPNPGMPVTAFAEREIFVRDWTKLIN